MLAKNSNAIKKTTTTTTTTTNNQTTAKNIQKYLEKRYLKINTKNNKKL